MSFLEEVIDYIETAGIATFGTNMFATNYSSLAPDECLLVLDSPGGEPYIEVPVTHPSIQVIARANDYPVAHAKALLAYNLFHGPSKHNYRIGSYYVLVSHAMQTPGGIGRDTKGREEVSVNFSFKIEEGR